MRQAGNALQECLLSISRKYHAGPFAQFAPDPRHDDPRAAFWNVCGKCAARSLPVMPKWPIKKRSRISSRLPFVGNVEAVCDISYLDGELDASLHFIYDGHKIPSTASKLTYEDVHSFVSSAGDFSAQFGGRETDHRRSIPRFYFQSRDKRLRFQIGEEDRRIHDRYDPTQSASRHNSIVRKIFSINSSMIRQVHFKIEPYFAHRYL